MKLPSARALFKTYIAILVVIALGAAVVAALGRFEAPAALRSWQDDDGAGYARVVVFRGPDPAAALGVAATPGEAFHYGPLAAGECLPPFDVAAYAPTLALHGVGALFNFGRMRGEAFDVVASLGALPLPPLPPETATHLQVCFPSGIDHEQVLWLAPRGTARGDAFPGAPRIAPPPLRRVPATLVVHPGRSPSGHMTVGERTVFSAVGRTCEVRLDGGEAPVVVEAGEIGQGWRFVVRDTLRLGGDGNAGPPPALRWPYFRIVYPEGVASRLALAPTEGD